MTKNLYRKTTGQEEHTNCSDHNGNHSTSDSDPLTSIGIGKSRESSRNVRGTESSGSNTSAGGAVLYQSAVAP